MKNHVHVVAQRVREIHEEILRLCPHDTRRNVRVALPEARDGYAMVRVTHVDALDVAQLSARFPDICIFSRDAQSGGACIDLYVPYSTALAARMVRCLSLTLYAAALVASFLGARVLLA